MSGIQIYPKDKKKFARSYFHSTHTKTGMMQKRLAWILCKDVT